MAKLITGGSGFIGAELAHILVERGEEVVVFDKVRSKRLDPLAHKITVVLGDLHNWSEVMNVIKNHRISSIYHMGAMLTFASEANPGSSFEANVVGTYNLLEAARLLGVGKVMFTSSIGTFAPDLVELTDSTIQRPTTFYGVSKVFGEGLGLFYRRKFGMDFRSIRYPAVLGPGVTTPNHWQAPMIQHAALGKPYRCPVPDSSGEPILYYKDAVAAADAVALAPLERIQTVNYNVGGMPSVSARELEGVVKELIPEAVITYPAAAAGSVRPPRVWDDSCARKEWVWQPAYPVLKGLVADFIAEIRSHPERYQE